MILEFALAGLWARLKIWWRARPAGWLWSGLPVLIALAGTLGIGVVLIRESRDNINQKYTAVTDRALATHDYETARVASLRRLALGIDPRPEIIYKLAQALNGLGKNRDATALLNDLAPPGQPGYGPAQLTMVQSLLARPTLTAVSLREAELQLAGILKEDPHSKIAAASLKALSAQMKAWEAGKPSQMVLAANSLEAHELAGWLYFQGQDWAAAKPHLLAEVDAHPSVMLMLARMAKISGDDAGSHLWLGKAETFYRAKTEQTTADDPVDRVAWAQADAMEGKYDEALKIIEIGQRLSGTNLYGTTRAWIYSQWAEAVATGSSLANPAARNLQVFLQKQLESESNRGGAEGKIARESLARMRVEVQPSPQLYTTLGMKAWHQGDLAGAADYFNRAYESDPGQPSVANNLALILAVSDPPQLEQALAISQRVVDKYPRQPNFRDTHGQILVKLGRWQEAVKDLEYALPKLQNNRATREALEKAYLMLNRLKDAQELEKLA